MGKRNLTDNEISALQANSCWAEDWQRIEVSDDFKPNFFYRVMFYGDISLGSFTECDHWRQLPNRERLGLYQQLRHWQRLHNIKYMHNGDYRRSHLRRGQPHFGTQRGGRRKPHTLSRTDKSGGCANGEALPQPCFEGCHTPTDT